MAKEKAQDTFKTVKDTDLKLKNLRRLNKLKLHLGMTVGNNRLPRILSAPWQRLWKAKTLSIKQDSDGGSYLVEC